jgi:hypothetical protein
MCANLRLPSCIRRCGGYGDMETLTNGETEPTETKRRGWGGLWHAGRSC